MKPLNLNILTALSAVANLILIVLFAYWQFDKFKSELIFFLAISNIPFFIIFIRFVSFKSFGVPLLFILSGTIALGSVVCSSYIFEFTRIILKKGISNFDDMFYTFIEALFYVPYVLIYWFNKVVLFCILAGLLNTFFMYKAGKIIDNFKA